MTAKSIEGPAFGKWFRAGPSCWERVTGIEPALSAWEADVLPLNYTRASLDAAGGVSQCLPRHRTGRGRLLACSYLTETSRRRSGRGE
jgi:hypothetical protein